MDSQALMPASSLTCLWFRKTRVGPLFLAEASLEAGSGWPVSPKCPQYLCQQAFLLVPHRQQTTVSTTDYFQLYKNILNYFHRGHHFLSQRKTNQGTNALVIRVILYNPWHSVLVLILPLGSCFCNQFMFRDPSGNSPLHPEIMCLF